MARKPSKDEMKDALKGAFEAANYRKPDPEETARIERAVDVKGQPGRPKKDKS